MDKYKFNIVERDTWIYPLYPIKLIHLNLDKNDKNFKIKKIYIFLGPQEPEIEDILNRLVLNPSQFKLTNKYESKLRHVFGERWKEIIGLNYIRSQKGGDDLIDIDFGDEVEKVEEPKKKVNKYPTYLSYIFKYEIFLDDSIDTIKDKIEIETNIEKINQHVFMNNTKDNKVFPLDYEVKFINRLEYFYDINILDLFKTDSLENILGFPVDLEFYKSYTSKNIKIKNNKYKIFYDILNRRFKRLYRGNFSMNQRIYGFDPFTIFVTDISDIFVNGLDMVDYNNIKNTNLQNFEKLRLGFILKYWPSISNRSMLDGVIEGKRRYELTNIPHLIKKYEIGVKLRQLVAQYNKKNIEKIFMVHPSIIMIHVAINNAMFNYLNRDIVDLRVLYEYLDTDDFMVSVEFGSKIKQNIKYKNLIVKSKKKMKKMLEKAKEKEATGATSKKIAFKLRYSVDIDRNEYNKIIDLSLNKNGNIIIMAAWKGTEHPTFQNFIDDVIPTANKFVEKINNLGSMVLIAGYQLDPVTNYNISVRYLNSAITFKLRDFILEQLDLIYIDPIKLPALIKLYDTFYFKIDDKFKINEPQNDMIKSLDVRFGKVSDYNVLNSKVQNQMSLSTQIIKTNASRLKLSQKEDEFKVSIYGTRDISTLHYISNFISRFLMLYRAFQANKIKDKEIMKILDLNEKYYLIAHKQYIRYSIPYSKRVKVDIPSYGNTVKFINDGIDLKKYKVKLLKEADNILFNYDHLIKKSEKKGTKKIIPYSRICQSNMQPIPVTDKELTEIKIKLKEENILHYPNRTRKGEIINYVCIDKTYKYPGFQNRDSPLGYCLPCCRKKKFMKNPNSSAYRKYMECMGKVPVKRNGLRVNKRILQNKKYIKGYGKIGPDRYSWLPNPLMKLFNESWTFKRYPNTFSNGGGDVKVAQKSLKCTSCNKELKSGSLYKTIQKSNNTSFYHAITPHYYNTSYGSSSLNLLRCRRQRSKGGRYPPGADINNDGSSLNLLRCRRQRSKGGRYPPVQSTGVQSTGDRDLKYISQCRFRKIRLLDAKSSKCFLLYGIKQSNRSYVTAIESALRIPYGSLLTIIINNLKKNKQLFNSLEFGRVKDKFKDLRNYINFIKNKQNIINENNIEDLISIFNPVYPKFLNVIIFDDQSIDLSTKIILKSKHNLSYLTSILEDSRSKIIILIKKKKYYYPMTQSNKFVYDIHHDAIKVLKKLISLPIFDSSMRVDTLPLSLQKNRQQFKKIGKKSYTSEIYSSIKLNQFLNIFDKIPKLSNNYRIIAQYVMVNNDKINISLGVEIESKINKNKFIFPIDPSPSKDLKIENIYRYGNFYTVYNFLYIFYHKVYSLSEKRLKVVNVILEESADNKLYVTGFMLPNKKIIYIKSFPLKKHGISIKKLRTYSRVKTRNNFKKDWINKSDIDILKHVFGKILYHSYVVNQVNKALEKRTPGLESEYFNYSDLKYTNELHRVLTLELNNKLFSEKNDEMRRKIIKYANSNFPITNYKNIRKIMKEISNNLKLNDDDSTQIEKILNIVYYKSRDSCNKTNSGTIKKDNLKDIKVLFNTLTFTFDLISIKQIRELFQDYKKFSGKREEIIKKLQNLLKKFMDEIIIIVKKVPHKKYKHKRQFYGEELGNSLSNSRSSKVIDLCSDRNIKSCDHVSIYERAQCVWDTKDKKGSCKIIMTKEDYMYHFVRLVDELSKNETKQSDLLDIKLDNIRDN